MNIAFLIDDYYSEQLAVTIASILKNDKHNIDFKFFILDLGISDKNRNKLQELAMFKPFKIEFLPIDINLFNDFPTREHLKTLNYARILLPNIIKNLDKVLFLDCDLLVEDDLNNFYNLDVEGKYACVIKERLFNTSEIQRQLKQLNIKKYFNAGVMLLNLKKMREDDIKIKALTFIEQYPQKVLLLDQCALNYAFADNVEFVEQKYNFQYKLGYSKNDFEKLEREQKPCIIHFVGCEKPYFGYNHPFENSYYKYLKLTPFKKSLISFKIKMFGFKLKRISKKIPKIFHAFKY